nr:hypothetical protein [Tanacetum cinerariifolium]
MTGNISYLSDYEPYDGGYVSFRQGGGKFTGKDFKLKDDTNVLLRTPRQHNMYSIDLNNIVPHKNLTCLVAKASADESMLWHRRLGHLNFKTMNKLVSHNLVKGLPSKSFENDHTCVAYLKGKLHKASCKTKLVNSVSKPLHTLYMDLFGPTSVSSLNHKWYCLVVTDDFSRFTWTFFLKTKDETSGILRNFITEIENLKDLKVKIIRTMLADAKLPVTFWAKAVNTACYVQNWVLVNKSLNKTPYELFNSRTPAIGFLKPFGCHVMILNTLDHLGKFDAKGDEDDSLETSSATRLISKRVTSQDETPSLDNILTLSNMFEDILRVSTNTVDTNRVEADLSNMESIIPASPTPTFKIHKDHPKSQIIGPVDNPVQTRHKSKEMEEHSFIATIYQKTTLDLLQFYLFSCFLSQEEPKKISDALKDSSWVEAMQEELL